MPRSLACLYLLGLLAPLPALGGDAHRSTGECIVSAMSPGLTRDEGVIRAAYESRAPIRAWWKDLSENWERLGGLKAKFDQAEERYLAALNELRALDEKYPWASLLRKDEANLPELEAA